MLNQARVIQREILAQLAFENSLQLVIIDLTVRADGLLELGRIDLRGVARFEINRASGEVDGKRDQPGDDVEEQAHGIEHGNRRVNLAVDLTATVRVENRTARGDLREQGGDQYTADQAKR